MNGSFHRGRWRSSYDVAVFPAIFLLLGFILQGESLGLGGDSWSFAWTVAQLVDHGRIAFSEAQGMTLIGQTFLAAPTAWLFSAEPWVLNRFTLVLSALTLGIFLLVLRRLGIDRRVSLLAAATVAVNPIWVAQSVSFETEIPFLFYSWLGVLALVEWDRTRRLTLLWCAALAFAGAVLVRQHGIVFAAAGCLYTLRTSPTRLASWLPWSLPAAAVVAFYAFIYETDRVPTAFIWQQTILRLHWSDAGALLWTSFIGLVAAMIYLGQFLLPVTVLRVRRPRTRAQVVALLCFGTFLTAAVITLWFRSSRAMPYVAGILDPVTILRSFNSYSLPQEARILWTVAGSLAAFVAFWAFSGADRVERRPVAVSAAFWQFLTLTACLFLAITLTIGMSFDRYLLLPLPFLIPALVRGIAVTRLRLLLSSVILGVGLVGSWVLVDQRVRFSECGWAAGQELLRSGIEARRINGGIAFNGYYSLEFLMQGPRRQRFAALMPNFNPEAEYLVTPLSQDRPGLTLLRSHRCNNLPGFGEMQFLTYQCEPRRPPATSTVCQPAVTLQSRAAS